MNPNSLPTWSVMTVVNGPIRPWNPPHIYFWREGMRESRRLEGVSCRDDEKMSPRDVSAHLLSRCTQMQLEAERFGAVIRNLVLANTGGGSVVQAEPIVDMIIRWRRRGVSTEAFVSTRAESMGGELVRLADDVTALRQTQLMWHQGYQVRRDTRETIRDAQGRPILSRARGVFRDAHCDWIRRCVKPDFVGREIGRAARAFNDPDNHLDDVECFGWEAYRAGIVHELVRSRAGLRDRYEECTHWSRTDWPMEVKRFFWRSAER